MNCFSIGCLDSRIALGGTTERRGHWVSYSLLNSSSKKPLTGLKSLWFLMNDEENIELLSYGKEVFEGVFQDFFEHQFHQSIFDKLKEEIMQTINDLHDSKAFSIMMNGESTVNFEQDLQQGKVILIDLSTKELGKYRADVLGKFIFSNILSHLQINSEKNKQTYIFINDFSNETTPNIVRFLRDGEALWVSFILSQKSIKQIKNVFVQQAVLEFTNLKFAGKNDAEMSEMMIEEFNK